MRWRTPFAIIILLVGLSLYCWGAMAVGELLQGTPFAVQVIYYLIAGFAWGWPCIYLFRWSAKDANTEVSNRTAEARFTALSKKQY